MLALASPSGAGSFRWWVSVCALLSWGLGFGSRVGGVWTCCVLDMSLSLCCSLLVVLWLFSDRNVVFGAGHFAYLYLRVVDLKSVCCVASFLCEVRNWILKLSISLCRSSCQHWIVAAVVAGSFAWWVSFGTVL